MNTSLTLFGHSLQLYRYPKNNQHKSLQAWDAADEYLIEHLQTLPPEQLHQLTIFNDDFGALGCWFADYKPSCYSDSFVAQQGCKQNMALNHIDPEQIQLHDSLTPVKSAKIVVIKIPKTTALLEQQLIDLQSAVSAETQIIAAGKVTAVQKSTLALFEKYLGPCTTSLAKKKSRLIFCQPTGDKMHKSPYPTIWKLEGNHFTISNLANVFSRQSLDIGGRFLVENLPDATGKTVIDLGCGNGVLGLSVLAQSPDAQVIFVDESYMAVASAKMNVTQNLPEALPRCQFIVNNCLEYWQHSKANIILCNPPFHQQNTITDHIAWQMFKESREVLHPGGELRIVGNRHLDYPAKLKRLFGGFKVVTSNKKFSILSAFKR